jgi:hypothetical protein
MKKFKSFLIFFIPFLIFFGYFTNQSKLNHSSASTGDHHMVHDHVEIPEGCKVPSVKVFVTQDQSGTWLLRVKTEHFSFAPEKVGMNSPSYNEGHAHIYINGKKINRLYGEYYNLGVLDKGKHEVKVTLNSNSHGTLVYKGQPVQDSATVKVK